MTDYQRKLEQQAEALKFYDAGVPSTLPNTNRFKSRVEAHRWGRHGDRPIPNTCPVCARTGVTS